MSKLETNGHGKNGRHPFATGAQRWLGLQTRDPQADGQFVYSVSTTGVFCRPTCPSKLARRENIAFHENSAAARRAGFRPCQRCHPEGASQRARDAEAAAQACRLIEASESAPSLGS